MTPPTKALADFLNHGILPFAGRDKEKEQLLKFWQATTDANGLRAALILGEAGIGKSRLVEEIIPDIVNSGGAVIHTKLYQESATTLVPLLTRSVWNSLAGRELLSSEPEANLESLNSALRRIASLRPTVIIVEDIQHLQSGGTRELATILEALADETLSFIATMRPAAAMSRSVLEQYLTEEIILDGLAKDAFEQVCRQLFDSRIDPQVVQALERATLGNALAIRSALRGALKTGFLDQRPSGWTMTVPPEAFFRHLENNVRSLSEGMAAHLDESERVACEALAVLGELFAVEAASALLSDGPAMLERLRFKGMITTSTSAHAPLAGKPSAYPLFVFSHALLHKYFLEHTHLWGDAILRLLAEDVSLYGITPYVLLEKKELTTEVSNSDLMQFFVNIGKLISKLDNGSDWELGFRVHDVFASCVSKYSGRLTEAEQQTVEFEMLRTKLTLLRRSIPHPEFKPAMERMVALSQSIHSTEDAERRLVAAMCEYWHYRRVEGSETKVPEIRATVDAIACAYPDVVLTRPYRILLSYFAQYASETFSPEDAASVEERITVMLAHPGCTEELHKFVLGYIYPEFLNFFSTKEELEERLQLADRIESLDVYLKASFLTSKGELLLDIGNLRDALSIIDRSCVLFREHGFRYSLYSANIKKLAIDVLYGRDTATLIEEAKSFISLLPTDASIDAGARRIIAHRLLPACLLVGEDRIADTVVREVMPAEQPASAEHLLLHALRRGNAIKAFLASTPSDKRYRDLFRAVSEQDMDLLHRSTQELLNREILRLNDILGISLIAELCRERTDLQQDVQKGITASLSWLLERELAVIMTAFLDRYGELLTEKDAKSWKQKLSRLKKKGTTLEPEAAGKIRLSMLGSIEFAFPGASNAERVRGARLRSVLGVMTANIMLSEPLGHKEFCAIAAGEKDDHDLARKTVNMAVAALRDDLGADAILTTGETPMLNLDRVHIDVIEASDLLNDASRHLRRGSLMKALADLNAATVIALGKVPFPTLYDNLFEALREDFDARLRKTTLDLSRRLLGEHDTSSAIVILRRFFDAIPDDEEVMSLLRDALIQYGEAGEAERIRIKVAESRREVA